MIGIIVSVGTATADRTGTITGEQACRDTARSYRNAGYTADCILLHGDKYVVEYRNSRTSNMPSTGSFG